jgi:hypothetical protein
MIKVYIKVFKRSDELEPFAKLIEAERPSWMKIYEILDVISRDNKYLLGLQAANKKRRINSAV